jgi:hypothetical protein
LLHAQQTYGWNTSRKEVKMSRFKWPIVISVSILAVIGLLLWGIIGWYADAGSRFWQWLTESFWGRGLFPNGWNIFGASDWAYLLGGLLVAGAALVFWPRHIPGGYDYDSGRFNEPMDVGSRTAAYVSIALAVLLVFSSVAVWFAGLNDVSERYASDTRFVVTDTDNLTTSLQRLDGRYIEEGVYSQDWEARVASATGAKTVMSRSSSSDSGNTLLLDTLTYTYGSQPGWTAIRDGKKKQPLYGVAFWPGEGNVTTCRFTGEYAINKALHGNMGNSLLDEIAAFDKSLFFDEQDMWGYCDGDKPVLVIPVKTWDGTGHRAVWYSGGVLVITGSSSGEAQIEHITDITPGQFPGPVYPISLAVTQREETAMMAGRYNKWFRDFGYETTGVQSQAGNSSEFLLKSKSDGHLYWVTPLTARSSDSQLVTAYSLIRADEAHNGTFNGLRIYVLANDDPRVVNLEDLEARTRQAISEADPGFFAAQGTLVEFLPLDDENWQVYAELGGRVVYRITVPADARVRPQVTRLDGFEEAPVSPSSTPSSQDGSNCAADLSALSNDQLASCLADIAEELKRRQEPANLPE